MRIREAVLEIEEQDMKQGLNSFIATEGILINKINLKKENVEIKGHIKKIFTLDFSCNVVIENISAEKIKIKIKDVKALKINLFSIIEKVVTRRGNLSLGRYISIDKDLIIVNLDVIKRRFKNLDFEINDAKIIKNKLELKFNYINFDLMNMIKKNIDGKKDKMVN